MIDEWMFIVKIFILYQVKFYETHFSYQDNFIVCIKTNEKEKVPKNFLKSIEKGLKNKKM